MNLEAQTKLTQMMNITEAVNPIAIQFVCSSAVDNVLVDLYTSPVAISPSCSQVLARRHPLVHLGLHLHVQHRGQSSVDLLHLELCSLRCFCSLLLCFPRLQQSTCLSHCDML